mmetsp:Transcript_111046/g.265039  ORF Transcript_111046/g.265039 Transcript_111046/m.265039 type:complete len:284 (-) Transcript_111046:414-1265(-)
MNWISQKDLPMYFFRRYAKQVLSNHSLFTFLHPNAVQSKWLLQLHQQRRYKLRYLGKSFLGQFLSHLLQQLRIGHLLASLQGFHQGRCQGSTGRAGGCRQTKGAHIRHVGAGLIGAAAGDGHNLTHGQAFVLGRVGDEAGGRAILVHLPHIFAQRSYVTEEFLGRTCRPFFEVGLPSHLHGHPHGFSCHGFLELIFSPNEDVGQIQGSSAVAAIQNAGQATAMGQPFHHFLEELSVWQHARCFKVQGHQCLMVATAFSRFPAPMARVMQQQSISCLSISHQPL